VKESIVGRDGSNEKVDKGKYLAKPTPLGCILASLKILVDMTVP